MANNATTGFQKAITGRAYHDNGAAIMWGGNASTTNGRVTTAPGLSVTATTRRSYFPPDPSLTSLDYTQKALSAGVFGRMRVGKYTIKLITSELAGVANTTVRMTGGGQSHRAINYLERRYSRLQRAAGWDYVTGAMKTTPTVSTDSFGNDNAGRSGRTSPGKIYFGIGKRTTVSTSYSNKTD